MKKLVTFLILLFATNAYAVDITSLPYTISSPGTYEIAANLSTSSSPAITIDASNVTLQGKNGTNYRVTYNGGKGIEIDSGKDDITIQDFELYQGTAIKDGTLGGNVLIYGPYGHSTIILDNMTFRQITTDSNRSFGIRVEVTSNASEIRNSTFNLTGSGRFYFIHQSDGGPWNIHDNEFNVVGHTQDGTYPWGIYPEDNTIIEDNVFNIDGTKVNVIGCWNRDNVTVTGNTINYSSSNGGRIIFPDQGSRGWVISNNIINVTSNVTGPDVQYIIRVRNDTDSGNSGDHSIFNNTIEYRNSSGEIHGISLADDGTVDSIRIYENVIKGTGDLINYYGSHNLTNIDVYCNDLEVDGGGYAINIGSVSCSDHKYSYNNIVSDGDYLVYVNGSETGVTFCNSDVASGDVDGTVTINNTSCQNGSADCWDDAGAGEVTPTAGITVTQSNETVTEAGGTDTFTIVLDTQPGFDVSLTISSSATDEGTVSPSSLTFTDANWDTPQTVTITGVDDDVADGDQNFTIIIGAATSSDPDYSGINPPDVIATCEDDDTPGVTVTPTSGLSISEDGTTDTYTVALDSKPESTVTISVTSGDTGEGTVSTASLVFTTGNWQDAQTVTVTGQPDGVDDGNVEFNITHAASSSDTNYDGISVSSVSCTNTDVDTPNTSSSITVTAGGNATATISGSGTATIDIQ